MDMENDAKKQLSLELKPDVAKGNYSNLAVITHSPSEFVIDFASTLPGMPGPKINNRIIMSPEHAKRLLNALSENIARYESHFGKIELETGATYNLADMMPNGNTKS